MADVTLTFAAKDAGFAAAMQRMQSRLAGFNSSMGGMAQMSAKVRGSFGNLTRSVVGLAAAYVGVSQAINAFNKALGMADRLDDLSKITGASAGDLAVLERAFDNTGVGGDRMLPMLSKMTKFVDDLGKGNKEAVATGNMLGVSFDQLNRLAPIARFNALMRAIMGVTSENQQNSAAMDVFGTRAGLVATLLAKDFNGALGEARKQLGSLPEILNESGSSMGELNDKIRNSVLNKPTEFTVGFLAGIQGANDFAEALTNIDAAGFGKRIGQMFAGIAKDPGSGFVLFGEMLLLGVMKAGNALANASIFAADVYKKALSNPSTFKGLMDALLAGFQMIFNFAASMTQTIVKTFVQGLAGIASLIPGIGPALARSIAEPIASIEKLQEETAKQGEALRARMSAGMGSTAADILATAKTMPRSDVDFLGEDKQEDEVKNLAARLSQLGSPMSKSDQFFEQINKIYHEEVENIHALTTERDEQLRRLETLRAQYRDAAAMGINKFGEPSAMYAPPPVQQVSPTSASSSQSATNAIVEAVSNNAQNMAKVATETTLQQVATLLEALNTKLPQPVLA